MSFDPSRMSVARQGTGLAALPPDLNALTSRIIGCAIEVHRHLGPGLREIMYERALELELRSTGLRVVRQAAFSVEYKGELLGDQCLDMLVEDTVIVENKATDRLTEADHAQLVGYLELACVPVGLLINYRSHLLKDSIYRKINFPPKASSRVLSVRSRSFTAPSVSAPSVQTS